MRGRKYRGGVTLIKDLVGALGVVRAFKKVIEAHFVESRGACICGDMPANGNSGTLGAVHHDRGIPADHRPNAAFYKFIARKPRLVIGRD